METEFESEFESEKTWDNAALQATITIFTGIAILLAVIIIITMLFKGIEWTIAAFLVPVQWINGVSLLIGLPVGLALLIFRKSRPKGGLVLLSASYGIGLNLWFTSFMVVYSLAGMFWMIVGFVFGGIGVVPIAIIVSLFKGRLDLFLLLLISLVVVYILRAGGAYFSITEKEG